MISVQHSPHLGEKPLIIAIGNPWRGDDGVAVKALESLQQNYAGAFEFKHCQGEATTLMELWKHREDVRVIDALSSGQFPVGSVQVFEPIKQTLPAELFTISSHGFGLFEAIQLSEALDCLPKNLRLVCIEASNFAVGQGLSPEVKQAIDKIIEETIR
ncbi:MAG: hydrogenase maturation protease [Nitrosomonas sp.]|nr:hydrogenase maturation protease [Nitrosomonas sp.]